MFSVLHGKMLSRFIVKLVVKCKQSPEDGFKNQRQLM